MAGEHYRDIEVRSVADLRNWLEANHAGKESVWLVTFKKQAGAAHVPYDAVVDELLCFGWVDSLPRKLDVNRSKLLISPRKAKSAWSAVNKTKVERLMADGRMRPAGLAMVELAKASGTWTKLDEVDSLLVPEDLMAALKAQANALDHFNAFPKSTRRGILEWILQAKKPETRAQRISETARLAADNIRANQFRQPKGR